MSLLCTPAVKALNRRMKNTTTMEPMKLLERALCTLQDGVCIIDNQLKICYINDAARNLIEKRFDMHAEAGDYFLDLISEERRPVHSQHISIAFDNKTSSFDVEYAGSVWYEIHYYPMPDEEGLVSHVCIRAKEITKNMQLEKQLLSERRSRRSKVIKATIEAQERERSLIGRELHDNVNQVLTTVKLYVELSMQEDAPTKDLLSRSVQQINYCIEEIRSLSRRLAVPKMGELDFEELIRDLVDNINITRKTSIEFLSYGIKNRDLKYELQTTIYRIIQEQLTNVLKYAHATSVQVIVAGTSRDIAVQVQDNGIGFNFREKRNGNGITNMISRAETVGGSLKIDTSPGMGCTLTAEFPINF